MFIANKIKLVRLPSHTSSALQPLDKTVFRTVKNNYVRYMNAFMHQKTHLTSKGCATLQKFEMAKAFHLSWKMAIESNELARKGFAATGIFPLRENWVNENVQEMSMSVPFSTSGRNRQLAAISLQHGNLGYQESADIFTARAVSNLIRNFKDELQDFLVARNAGISAEEIGAMSARVSSSQYSNQATDGTYN